MKTYEELIIDFMLALAQNPSVINHGDAHQDNMKYLYMNAKELAWMAINNGEMLR